MMSAVDSVVTLTAQVEDRYAHPVRDGAVGVMFLTLADDIALR
ncbi:Uncharacterised protein [Cedecea neteri]|uniref:Uncharacterized protein n=1 Tax=Cedecea neteri TaxID=158822 RepID=A0A2X3JAC2_9ENTR|nr:hypothetical protein [Cedecea neteri]SQC91994.1 Uncharacterised protein [Cedecea neteri]